MSYTECTCNYEVTVMFMNFMLVRMSLSIAICQKHSCSHVVCKTLSLNHLTLGPDYNVFSLQVKNVCGL